MVSQPPGDASEANPFLLHQESLETSTELRSRRGSRTEHAHDLRFASAAAHLRRSLYDFEYPKYDIPLDVPDQLTEALTSDPELLQQELNLALGHDLRTGLWRAASGEDDSDEGAVDDDTLSTNAPSFFNGVPGTYPTPRHASHGFNPDSDLTYDIPMITLDTAALDVPRGLHDLEAGHLSRLPSGNLGLGTWLPSKIAPGSPSKLLGLLTRISDRIAGSNNPPTPLVEKDQASLWGTGLSDAPARHLGVFEDLPALPALSFTDAASTSFVNLSLATLPHLNSSSHANSSESVPDALGISTQQSLTPLRTAELLSLRRTSELAEIPATTPLSASRDTHTPHTDPAWHHLYLHGKTLGIFGPSSRLRIACHRVMSHKRASLVVLLLILIQTGILVARQWDPAHNDGYVTHGYNAQDYVLMVINCIYTLEIIAKIIAYGLYDDKAMFDALGLENPNSGFSYAKSYFGRMFENNIKVLFSFRSRPRHHFDKHESQENIFADSNAISDKRLLSANVSNVSLSHPSKRQLYSHHTFIQSYKLQRKVEDMNLHRAFLKSNWQRLDLISVLCFWISLPLSLHHWDAKNHFMLFRALSCLRILRLCNLTTGTNIMLRACESSIPQLIDVSIFIICFWFIIAIIGVQSFKSSLSRHCVWTNPDDSSDTYTNSDLYCGSYIGLDGITYPYLDRHGENTGYVKGYTCPMYSVCQSGENPYGGTVNFDNILQSMQMVFVLISVNTFSDIMYDVTDTDNLGAAMFFVIGIFILTVWLMNIFTAVIVSSFKIVQREAAEEQKKQGGRKKSKASWLFSGDVHSNRVRTFIESKPLLRLYYRFEYIFVIVIFITLATQAFRDSNMTANRERIMYRIEMAGTCILLFEIILRFVLYLPQWTTFFLSRRNCFDLLLAAVTTAIIFIKSDLGQIYYWLTFFQVARFYRVVLLFRATSDLWLKLRRNAKAIYDLALFYFILLVLSGIIVARYFEGTVPIDDVNDVQFAMHTLPNTVMSLYVITSTENWASIMYELQVYANNVIQRSFGSIFIIMWFVITNLVILNIFIAVIANSLEVSEEGRKKHQLRQFIDDMTERLQAVRSHSGWIHKLKSKVFKSREDKNIEKAVTNLLLSGSAVNDFLDGDDELPAEEPQTEVVYKTAFGRLKAKGQRQIKDFFHNPFYAAKKEKTNVENFNPAAFATRVITERKMLIKKQDDYLKANPRFNSVFYVLQPQHRLRRICQRIVPSSHGERVDGVEPNKTISELFTAIMFLSTIGIVVTACYLTPLYRRQASLSFGKWNWTFYIDSVFLVIFSIEFSLKVLADGLIFTPNAYWRSPWNWLDFGALLSFWIELVAFLRNDGNLSQIIRGMKALRALRILTISETAKNNFHFTMISGFGKILNAGFISLTLLLPFSLWGLNVFNGRLGYCVDGSSLYSQCINEYEGEVFNWEVISPNVYELPILHMDRFSSSFSTFYQIVSLEGWTDLLINVMQSTGVGTPQQMFASPINGIFIIGFNFISTVFILTLFVSVIINNYSRVTGRAYLTGIQIQWYHVKKYLLKVRPSVRSDTTSLNHFQRFCYKLTVDRNKYWSTLLNCVLILHVIMLALEAFPHLVPDTVRYAFFMVSSSCFLAHEIMLGIAYGYKIFVRNKWNIFSLVIAIGAWLSTIMGFAVDAQNIFMNFNKLFLVALLIFLFPRSDRLNQLLKFASASFPSLFSLMFTWFVIFLVYAIAMNQVFGLTRIGQNTTNNINLRSVPKALILLFRCSFGEGWNYIMEDFTVELPYCYSDELTGDSDCGNQQYAYILFMSWNVISMYIMLNLFVSLILDSFSYIAGGTKYSHLISRPEIRRFKKRWQKFDPEGTGFIKPEDLSKFLHSLDGSLSFHFYTGVLSIPELCSKWIVRNNPSDPYDIHVDCDEMNSILLMMDIPKIQRKRYLFQQFCEEAYLNMELHEEPGISFSRLIVQIPLYSSFNPAHCLVLIDFLEERLLHKKISERLRKKRCFELIEGYACRWRYMRWKRGEILTAEFFAEHNTSRSPFQEMF